MTLETGGGTWRRGGGTEAHMSCRSGTHQYCTSGITFFPAIPSPFVRTTQPSAPMYESRSRVVRGGHLRLCLLSTSVRMYLPPEHTLGLHGESINIWPSGQVRIWSLTIASGPTQLRVALFLLMNVCDRAHLGVSSRGRRSIPCSKRCPAIIIGRLAIQAPRERRSILCSKRRPAIIIGRLAITSAFKHRVDASHWVH
jgi:hypothetical protein